MLDLIWSSVPTHSKLSCLDQLYEMITPPDFCFSHSFFNIPLHYIFYCMCVVHVWWQSQVLFVAGFEYGKQSARPDKEFMTARSLRVSPLYTRSFKAEGKFSENLGYERVKYFMSNSPEGMFLLCSVYETGSYIAIHGQYIVIHVFELKVSDSEVDIYYLPFNDNFCLLI